MKILLHPGLMALDEVTIGTKVTDWEKLAPMVTAAVKDHEDTLAKHCD